MRRFLWLLLCLPALFLNAPPQQTTAQSTTQAYWRHTASRGISQLIPADINHDGIAEFVIAAENGRVELLGADGVSLWTYLAAPPVDDPLTGELPVAAITPFNLDGDENPQLEIALIAGERLQILSSGGDLLQEHVLRFVAPPPGFYTFSDAATAAGWMQQYPIGVAQMMPFDHNGDGRDELLVLLDSGSLHLFDAAGSRIWQYDVETALLQNAQPQLTIHDFNQDGLPEILLGGFYPRRRFSILQLIDAGGQMVWDQPITGSITAISLVPFDEAKPPVIAVGTDRGQLHLYDYQHNRLWWPRSLNKAVTALAPLVVEDEVNLVVGTEVGVVAAYQANGSRTWTRRLAPQANRPVLRLSSSATAVTNENEAALAVLLGHPTGAGNANDVQLLNIEGRSLSLFAGQDSTSFSQMLDINQDGQSELLFSRFSILELLGLGVGTSETAQEWEYSLDAAPSSFMVVDFDRDGDEELLIGAQNGRLHYLNNQNNPEWIVAPGDEITHLALFEPGDSPESASQIVLVRNRASAGLNPADTPTLQSWIEMRQTNGDPLWEVEIDATISTLLIADINQRGSAEIVVGTADGRLQLYSPDGGLIAEKIVADNQSITHLELLQGPDVGSPLFLLAATTDTLYRVDVQSAATPVAIAAFVQPITDLFVISPPSDELALAVLVFTELEAIGLNWRGIRMPSWPLSLNGRPAAAIPANDIIEEAFEERTTAGFIFVTAGGTMQRISINGNEPAQNWSTPVIGEVTDIHWGDIDGDALPEIVVGSNDTGGGLVRLYNFRPQLIDEFQLDSGVFGLTVLQQAESNRSDLLVISENGTVQLFRAQENRPPLLTNPQTAVVEGQYNFTVAVADVEGDTVSIGLEFRDANGFWQPYETQSIRTGNDRVFWQVAEPPATNRGVEYRFSFEDGIYSANLTPPPGPPPAAQSLLATAGPALFAVIAGGMGTAVFLLLRQAQSTPAQARRFYRQLQRDPAQTLPRLARKYIHTDGSQEFLLYLATQARQRRDDRVRSLADGLFLLSDRPPVALPIITTTLAEISQLEPAWAHISRWQMIFKTGQALLDAPTITEISLLRPQLVELLDALESRDVWLPVLDALLPVMTNLRDSERVDLAEDRLVYLNEAAYALQELLQNLSEFSLRIERTLVAAIARRWVGLVSAATEELRGRAELVVQLKTRRVAPGEKTEIVIECVNNGRSPAENIIVVLEEDPAYTVQSPPQVISFLPPGRQRQFSFKITPQVTDRFRVGVQITYDDRSEINQRLPFGDMVYILQPQRTFTPIANPYLPGTPLRRRSTVFYGREQLFNFIADNAGGWSQRNVLILIGQRRTGKTSALLRLEQHLPANLLPIYIDCQSLGVMPGMGALFHDLAWLISDALALRDIELEVPDMAVWEENPTVQFQRHFLPGVKALLSDDTTLLLVFDEFEAFENLVNDGILPQTFFNFMRHLMQHSEGLSFIFVGTKRLQEMSADYWSVLFNIALYERIGYLDTEAAIHLITEPVAPHLVYDDLAIDKILRVTAGHPYFLQLVCYTLVNRANRQALPYITISDVNAALEDMLSLGEVHFAYLWQRSTAVERALLTAVAHMMERDRPLHPEDFMQFLGSYGIDLQPSAVTTALNRLVEREIMSEIREDMTALYTLKIGLVGLWTAQHKSLSRLYETTDFSPAGNGENISPRRKSESS